MLVGTACRQIVGGGNRYGHIVVDETHRMELPGGDTRISIAVNDTVLVDLLDFLNYLVALFGGDVEIRRSIQAGGVVRDDGLLGGQVSVKDRFEIRIYTVPDLHAADRVKMDRYVKRSRQKGVAPRTTLLKSVVILRRAGKEVDGGRDSRDEKQNPKPDLARWK